jgi:hypothetical protein
VDYFWVYKEQLGVTLLKSPAEHKAFIKVIDNKKRVIAVFEIDFNNMRLNVTRDFDLIKEAGGKDLNNRITYVGKRIFNCLQVHTRNRNIQIDKEVDTQF